MDAKQNNPVVEERIASWRDKAIRDLVRTNAMLAAEVRYLRAVVNGQDPVFPCKGCRWWHSIGPRTAYCEDTSTPEEWYLAAPEGGEPCCPNFSPHESKSASRPGL